MREHLYKARRKDNGEWVEGSLVTTDSYRGDDWYSAYILPKVLDCLENFNKKSVEVEIETICQSVGKIDTKGIATFTGDKCMVWESKGVDGRLRRGWAQPLTIVYDDYLAMFCFEDKPNKQLYEITHFEVFEIIESIHDKEAAK